MNIVFLAWPADKCNVQCYNTGVRIDVPQNVSC
jgi:hypothetical protein